jgi:hypothetical protein
MHHDQVSSYAVRWLLRVSNGAVAVEHGYPLFKLQKVAFVSRMRMSGTARCMLMEEKLL